jgi:hypothetical protein
VVAGRQIDDQVPFRGRTDVLDLPDDPVTGGVHVDLGRLPRGVGDLERVPARG